MLPGGLQDAPKHTAEGLLQAVAPATLVAHAKTLARTQASSALRGRRAQACEAACIAQLLHGFLQPLLQQEGLLRPLCDVEMPLVPVLADMEAAGFAFDPAILKQVKVNAGILFNMSVDSKATSYIPYGSDDGLFDAAAHPFEKIWLISLACMLQCLHHHSTSGKLVLPPAQQLCTAPTVRLVTRSCHTHLLISMEPSAVPQSCDC